MSKIERNAAKKKDRRNPSCARVKQHLYRIRHAKADHIISSGIPELEMIISNILTNWGPDCFPISNCRPGVVSNLRCASMWLDDLGLEKCVTQHSNTIDYKLEAAVFSA